MYYQVSILQDVGSHKVVSMIYLYDGHNIYHSALNSIYIYIQGPQSIFTAATDFLHNDFLARVNF